MDDVERGCKGWASRGWNVWFGGAYFIGQIGVAKYLGLKLRDRKFGQVVRVSYDANKTVSEGRFESGVGGTAGKTGRQRCL